MSLLGRAKTMIQGWGAPPPPRAQSYSVACSEGHRLTGQRTEGYQALRCPTCGEGIFVLPRSPLPIPPSPAPRTRTAIPAEGFHEDGPILLSDPPLVSPDPVVGTNTGDVAEAEIDWVDESTEGPAEASAASRPATAPKPKALRPSASPAARDVPPAEVVTDRRTWFEWAQERRNPLLVAAVILLVICAVAFRHRRQRLDQLPEVAEIGRTEGLKRLDAGEFQPAKKLLTDAAAAVDQLGGSYEGAEAIRQGAREASIFTDLSREGLDGLLEKAATYRGAEVWSTHFANFYRGQSFILDTVIVAEPNPSKSGTGYVVECPILTGRGPKADARARLDLSGFKLFEDSKLKKGDPAIFGARLASLELDIDTGEWVFAVEPDSGVFITHPKALEALGWPPPEVVEEPRP